MKGLGMFVGPGDEGFDRLPQLLLAGKTGAAQRLSRQQSEPDLDLVKPACGSRREMELNSAAVAGKPVVVALVG
jgi:hypothetical protein